MPYGMLLESDADRNAGSEFYALTYDSWDDVQTNTIGPQQFTPLDINPLFSSAGFTFDGSGYRLLLESVADRNAGAEIYQVTYNTWADLLANNIGAQNFTPLDVNPLFSIGGFGALALPTSQPPTHSVPEPSTLVLLALALVWLAVARGRLANRLATCAARSAAPPPRS